jgi:hypothetical protein
MSTLPGPQQPKRQRKNALRIFYIFLFVATGTFTVAVEVSQAAQEVLFALGIVLAGGGIWSFLRFLKVADTHQRLVNHEATSFAFVGSLLLALAVGILQRFGLAYVPSLRIRLCCMPWGLILRLDKFDPTAPTKPIVCNGRLPRLTTISRLKTIEAVPTYLFFSTLRKKKIR